MGDEAKVLIAMWIKNCVVPICFTILAIVFEKWWIAMISILFWISYNNKAE